MKKEDVYMNISEVEKQTGITKQNIRFYEKEGLLYPVRNNDNGYREYGTEEVRRLKLIYILRKTGMSIQEIKKVFDGEVPFSDAVAMRQEKLLQEREQQNAVMDFCEDLKMQSLEWMDADQYVEKIKREEKKGNMFFDFLDDYRAVYLGERKKKFYFYPDNIIETPDDFTKALLKYAKENKGDIILIKEGMYPEFVYNGVEYTAMRVTHKYGPTVHCEMKYPELAEPVGIEGRKKTVLQKMARYLPTLLLVSMGMIFFASFGYNKVYTWQKVSVVVVLILLLVFVGLPYLKRRK